MKKERLKEKRIDKISRKELAIGQWENEGQ